VSGRGASPRQLEEILLELRRVRRDVTRSEDEIWTAIDRIHETLLEAGAGRERASRGSAAQERPGGSNGAGSKGAPDTPDYLRLKRRLRRFLEGALPEGSEVVVVSRGDEELLRLNGLRPGHFPQALDGRYAGYYPPDGTALVAHLEWVRARGARYLVFPSTALWWLDSFPRLAAHLERRAEVLDTEDGVGTIWDLDAHRGLEAGGQDPLAELLNAWEEQRGAPPALLDWGTGLELLGRYPGRAVFSPPAADPPLPYLDHTVDVVAVGGDDPERLAEARRVASLAVVRFPSGSLRDAVVEHLGGPPAAPPSVSIVIPSYDGTLHLSACLRALQANLPPRFVGEVVVVDDGGRAETRRALAGMEALYPWLRVVRNRRNRGFIDSCNRGAEEAAGEYLVFLNDDTVPLPGWLPALLTTFRTHADAGAVGGRLVYPDGRLQEAGGVIYNDASGANFGRGDADPDGPLYTHVRSVAYCSGALLATRRELFRSLGGFDAAYRPAYYEDSDFCFSVRSSGLGVYYQPDAAVVHAEGATSGTDLTSGPKRHQVSNRVTFARKWKGVLGDLPEPPARYTVATWHRLAALERVG